MRYNIFLLIYNTCKYNFVNQDIQNYFIKTKIYKNYFTKTDLIDDIVSDVKNYIKLDGDQ